MEETDRVEATYEVEKAVHIFVMANPVLMQKPEVECFSDNPDLKLISRAFHDLSINHVNNIAMVQAYVRFIKQHQVAT